MSKKVTKEAKVKELNTELVDAPVVQEKQEAPVLKLPADEANAYLQVLGIILVGDDRLKSVQTHFVDMLKRHNEELKEQPQ